MDIREMEYFVAIAQHKNLTHAAAQLYVSQPALTKYIQRLEEELGLTLFEKIGKQLELTYAGTRYLHYVNQFLSVNHNLENELMEIKKAHTGLLRVGMPPFRFSFVLPAVLPEFKKKYPHVELELVEESSARLDELLLEGKLDLVFYNVSRKKPRLTYETIEKDELYAILPKDHPLKQQSIPGEPGRPNKLYISQLKNEVFLLQNRKQRQGEYVYRELENMRFIPKIQETSNIRASALLAASGYGVAFITGGLMRHLETEIAFDYYSLIDVRQELEFCTAWRTDSFLPEYSREFIRLVKMHP